MSQAEQYKPRKCKHCQEVFHTTAQHLKDHAKDCAGGRKTQSSLIILPE